MIKIGNFESVLVHYGFLKSTDSKVYYKKFDSCEIGVDFEKKTMLYPASKGMIINDKTTSNFDKDENFVVFECVCRLLQKGYRPEHIELEPKWQLGRETKGGKADILIKNEEGKSYIIIECKTAGKEYKKELENTENYGGQLFSYWQQEASTNWLALYASDYNSSDGLSYKCNVIRCTDDENIKKMAEKDKDVLIFDNAKNEQDRFKVWRDTYYRLWLNDVIFDKESKAYAVGVAPLRKKNLVEFKPEDKIVNKFEEILRHNNVSDKENAFNRLVALFICKLVDEITKNEDDEVDFQYKQGTDTYEILQDRLQRLHKQGMEEFMREDIFYIEPDYAEKLFANYIGQKRTAAIEELNRTIKILKFYSNNDFAFKDVHNRELFFQNGKILVEVIRLFQPYKIVYHSRHQFLGDLFEQLLAKGFKQNEGQFFTPKPITRFIWDSLPIKTYISTNGLPKVIDYSCGSGHFLTEAVEAINESCLELQGKKRTELKEYELPDNVWVKKCLFGIEKDYRLARVAKISMFMNGAGDANIIFGDGLENYSDKEITNNRFDILVANPPYSVECFKVHLKLKNNKFSLIDKITDNGSEIESLFIERASQLVKPGGLAAIILPDPILFKSYSSYIGARKILLESFSLKAIVRCKGKTFSATTQETVILFLQRYQEPPKHNSLASDFVDAVINNQPLENWIDREVFDAYLEMQKISETSYHKFIEGTLDWEYMWSDNYYKQYCNEFCTISISVPKTATTEEVELLRRIKFNEFTLEIEKEKLHYFYLAYKQSILIVDIPKDNALQKKILGYSWTNRSGYEGILETNPGGKLFNNKDRYDDLVLSGCIRKAYLNKEYVFPNDISSYCKTIKLVDAIDFSMPGFSVSITASANLQYEFESDYPMIKLNDPKSFTLQIGKRILKSEIKESGKYPIYSANVKEPFGKIDSLLITDFSKDSILWGIDGDWMTNYIVQGKEFYPTDHCGVIRIETEKLIPAYVSYVLDLVGLGCGFSRSYRASIERVASMQIPMPPKELQKMIVTKCTAISNKYESSRMSIEKYREQILKEFYKQGVFNKPSVEDDDE
jgi:type I restriction-modification system DNA methylase subunit